MLSDLLSRMFGASWYALSRTEQIAVERDVREMAEDDFDGSAIVAARELRTRIGGAEVLPSYAKCLTARPR